MEIGSVNNRTQVYTGSYPFAEDMRRVNQKPMGEEEPKTIAPAEDDDLKTIGMSADGDTAKASMEAMEDLNDGMVLPKSVQNGEESLNADADKEKNNGISSLTGYTKDELSRLKLTGEISQNAYEREIERREQIKDDGRADSVEKSVSVSGETDENGIVADKADMSNEKAQEERKKIISEEMEAEDKFVKQMDKLNYESENIQLQMNGLAEAFANGRGELVSQIFEEGLLKGINQI